MLLPTSLVGSYAQPDWLIDREKLAGRFPPRTRMKELWRVPEEWLEQAWDDATVTWNTTPALGSVQATGTATVGSVGSYDITELVGSWLGDRKSSTSSVPGMRRTHLGFVDIDSAPPAMPVSICPDWTAYATCAIDCTPEAQ